MRGTTFESSCWHEVFRAGRAGRFAKSDHCVHEIAALHYGFLLRETTGF